MNTNTNPQDFFKVLDYINDPTYNLSLSGLNVVKDFK